MVGAILLEVQTVIGQLPFDLNLRVMQPQFFGATCAPPAGPVATSQPQEKTQHHC